MGSSCVYEWLTHLLACTPSNYRRQTASSCLCKGISNTSKPTSSPWQGDGAEPWSPTICRSDGRGQRDSRLKKEQVPAHEGTAACMAHCRICMHILALTTMLDHGWLRWSAGPDYAAAHVLQDDGPCCQHQMQAWPGIAQERHCRPKVLIADAKHCSPCTACWCSSAGLATEQRLPCACMRQGCHRQWAVAICAWLLLSHTLAVLSNGTPAFPSMRRAAGTPMPIVAGKAVLPSPRLSSGL